MSDIARVGVVGAGAIAHEHLAAWHQIGMQLRVFATGTRAAVVAAQYGAVVSPDLTSLIAWSHVVDVCVPTGAHPQIVAAAAAASRPVVCEKPLALSHVEAVGMISICERAGIQLYPAHVVRFSAQYAAARRAVRAGVIGRPTLLRLSRRGPVPPQAWLSDERLSGGVLLDLMIHDFDYARWVAGEVATVSAQVVHGSGRMVRATAVLQHSDGAVSKVAGAWGRPSLIFATSFSLTGSHGSIRNTSWARGIAARRDSVKLEDDSPFVAQLTEFKAALAGGPSPRVTARDGLAALDISLAAVRSAQLGRPVAPAEVAYDN